MGYIPASRASARPPGCPPARQDQPDADRHRGGRAANRPTRSASPTVRQLSPTGMPSCGAVPPTAARGARSRSRRCSGGLVASSPCCRCCRSARLLVEGAGARRRALDRCVGACCRARRPGPRPGTAWSPRRRHAAGGADRRASSRCWSSLTDIRGRNAFVFCFVLPLMIAPQVVALAWLQLFGPSSPLLKLLGLAPAARQPQSALFARGHHPAARRPVRAARVPHAARRPAHAAAGAGRGGARRRRRRCTRAAHASCCR